jgi:hypothetical protein
MDQRENILADRITTTFRQEMDATRSGHQAVFAVC